MSSSNPFDDGDSNPFFDTVKIQSPINEEDVFGGKAADEPASTSSGSAPMPAMALPKGSTFSSNSAVIQNEDDDESKPINFDDEQSKGREREMQNVGFTDKAVDTAANLLLEDDGSGESGEGGKRQKRKWYNFWRPSFYRPYFDVDTKDVLRRCLAGLVPIGKPFFERVEGNSDLYGPFWITTTILLFLAISSNFAEYLAYYNEGAGQYWQANFYKVSIAAAVFYAFLVGLPIILWALQRFLCKAKLTFMQILCVYGYSMTAFLIVTPACIAPFEWVRWMVILLACVLSCVCNIVALFKALKHDMAKGIIVIVVAVLFQVGLTLTYKLYFFAKISVPTSFSSSKHQE